MKGESESRKALLEIKLTYEGGLSRQEADDLKQQLDKTQVNDEAKIVGFQKVPSFQCFCFIRL